VNPLSKRYIITLTFVNFDKLGAIKLQTSDVCPKGASRMTEK